MVKSVSDITMPYGHRANTKMTYCTATPDDNKITVFNKGTSVGLSYLYR